jgi:hypothetical protein
LPPEQKTIVHVFNENDYKTAYITLWIRSEFHCPAITR